MPRKHLSASEYQMTSKSLENQVSALIRSARKKNLTIGTAESCTGGWIGKVLTDIIGSSQVFMGGLITYSDQSKRDVLGIPPEILKFYGAVSAPTASAMAAQARDILGVDIAVSVTGIAGPGGGSDEKPIGMVCFGIAKTGEKPINLTMQFGDLGRDIVRKHTVLKALELLQIAVTDYEPIRPE